MLKQTLNDETFQIASHFGKSIIKGQLSSIDQIKQVMQQQQVDMDEASGKNIENFVFSNVFHCDHLFAFCQDW